MQAGGSDGMTWTKLESGVEVDFENRPKRICKSCGSSFRWGITKKKRWIPVVRIEDKLVSHFANCPGAAGHRKPGI